MSSLNTLWLKKSAIEAMLEAVNKTGNSGIELTINVRDEANKYGQNVNAHISQNIEDKGKPKFYVGNGNTVWSDGKSTTFKKKNTGYKDYGSNDSIHDNLPF